MNRLGQRLSRVLMWLSIAVAAASTATAADKPIDISKLKPGDALEVRVGSEWVPAKFVDRFSDKLINVHREPFTIPVGAFIADVRIPKGRARTKSEMKGENPFATDEERAAARKPRTWSDQSGSFKVEATFLRVEDEKVVLRRADNKEIAVPLDRLSDADQEYVATLTGEEKPAKEEPFPGSRFPRRSMRDEEPPEPEFPITKTNLGAAPVVETATSSWTYQPDSQSNEPLRNARVPFKPLHIFERPERLLLSPVEKRAFLVTSNMSAKHFGVVAIDLQRGEGGDLSVFSKSSIPIAVSADAKFVLARSQSFGSGKAAELTLFVRRGLKVTPEKAWVPYIHHGPRANGVHGPHYPDMADVTWADFLDSERVMSLSKAGELALWNLKDLTPVYQAKLPGGGQPAFSGGRKYLAAATETSIVIIQANDGKVVGRLPAESNRYGSYLAFSPDGTKLAMLSHNSRLRVWDLETQKLERDFSTVANDTSLHLPSIEIAWVDGGFLLVGRRLFDIEHRCMVAEYAGLTPWAVYGNRTWFAADVSRAAALTSAQLPTPEVREKWASIPADDLLVIKPGMEVAVELQTNDAHTAESRELIVKSLTERGLKVVPNSEVKLIGKIGAGESKEVTYSTTGGLPFNRGNTTVNVQGRVLTLSYEVKGQVVWSYRTQTSAPHFVHMKQGESVSQAAQKGAELTSKEFQTIWVPVTVAKPPANVEPVVAPYPAS